MNTIEEILARSEELILTCSGKPLNFIQKVILQETLLQPKLTYAQIAQKFHYSEGYIKKVAAPKLWRLLSQAVEEKVTKYNCLTLLEQKLKNRSSSPNYPCMRKSQQLTLEFPEGQVPLNSHFYIERAGLESTCYQKIVQPGAFLHIKAPRKMGKTSLATRIVAYGTAHGLQTIYLSLEQVETVILSSISKFIRWFCANVTQQLGIEPKLNNYWDEDLGVLMSCTIYFQEYVLKQLSNPTILILDEVERVFEQPNIAHDFLALLQCWHEKSKDIALWRQLRLIMVNSTDFYLSLKTNHSLFNVGMTIELPSFTQKEVEDLARCHHLKLTVAELEQLIELTGGFPYLVRLTLYEIVQRNLSLETLRKEGITETGVFSNHLHHIFYNLQQNRDLRLGFQQVLNSPTSLDPQLSSKLESLGLVKLENNKAKVSCGLYQNYFGTTELQALNFSVK